MWNEAQKQAIESDANKILVSAAAGSGKTAVLVERIKRLVISERTPLSAMLIVTFTNAAASEMRRKITEAISDALEEADDPFLREQITGIYRAHISTFHAFAADVIRERYFEAGLPPGLRVCDETRRTLLRDEAADELFEARFAEDYERFSDFLNRYASGRDESEVRTMIFDLCDAVRAEPDAFERLGTAVARLGEGGEALLASGLERDLRTDVGETLRRAGALCARAREVLARGGADAYLPLCDADIRGLEALAEGARSAPVEQAAAAISDFGFARFAVSGEANKAPYRLVEDEVKRLREGAKKALRELAARYGGRPLAERLADVGATAAPAAYLTELILDFHARFARKKLEKGFMDFADMEHFALEILQNEDAAQAYRKKFRHIFIDEYQDSNLMQEALTSRINVGNAIFMVGDVKQSIYRFRLAEPELFTAKYAAFGEPGADGLRIDLNRNYRSRPAVIAAINAVFEGLMTRETAGVDYDENAALKAGRAEADADDAGAELWIANLESPDADAAGGEADAWLADMKNTEVEAAVAAEIVENALREPNGKRRGLTDPKTGVRREAEYRDIVILFRAPGTHAEAFRRRLGAAGIPAFVNVGEGYFDTVEIETFLNLLRVIDNRRRDVPLISVMYSPIFGFTIEELADIRLSAPERPYHEAVFARADEGDRKCAALLERLREWRERAAFMPLDEFVRTLLNESGYEVYASALPGGAQRRANLRMLTDKARDFRNTHMQGLAGFVGYVERIRARTDTAQAGLTGESENVLRIMTVHKSKGLEFPVVIVAGLGKRFRKDTGGAPLWHRELGLGLRITEPATYSRRETLLRTLIARRREREDMAEEIRILYVAFTRAANRLILLGGVSGGLSALRERGFAGASSYLEMLAPTLASAPITLYERTRATVAPARSETKTGLSSVAFREHLRSVAVSEETARETDRRLGFRYSHAEAVSLKSKYSVTELIHLTENKTSPSRDLNGKVTRPPIAVPAFARGDVSLTAADRGNAVHKLMEVMDFAEARARADDRTYFENILNDLARRGVLTREAAESVETDKLRVFLRSELCRRAAASSEVRKETPFVCLRRIGEETVPVQGVIDCFFAEPDGYVLMDYKSGRLRPAHRTQLALYAEALEKIRGVRVKEAYVCLLDEGENVRVMPE